MTLSFYFLSPVQMKRGSHRAALVGIWCPAKVNSPQEKIMFACTSNMDIIYDFILEA